ncbi:IS3 family transposase [Streptomyces sp. NPDC090080]|uniref:IS3 family transposase n=1 Tax=Streptomyces sp. NPDC090080 TaxID=3365939 RepID=UPI0037F9011E
MNDTYAFIEAEKTTHGVAFLCRLLKVARSSFYAWLAAARTRTVRKAADEALVHEITIIHVGSRQTYGVPRIHAELRRLGRRVNRKRVARLMREHGIPRLWPDRATARADVFDFIETFYNRRRLRKHKVFGYLTPAETRQRHQHGLAA